MWANTVRPYWPNARQILEADIVARSAQLGRGGWAAALDDMRPGIRWLGEGRLQINALQLPAARHLRGSAAVRPGDPEPRLDQPGTSRTGTRMMYPCSGVLAEPGRQAPVPAPLGALLGPGRARPC